MDELPQVISDLFGFYALTLLALGRRAGLTDALLAGPGTAAEMAARAGTDERNTAEWLRAMTARGYAAHQSGTFTPSEQFTMAFSPEFPFDMASGLEGCLTGAATWEDLVGAWRSGAGLTSDQLKPFGPFSDVNTPTYRQVLVDDWLGNVPGLHDRLSGGGRVAEIGAGNGNAARIVAEAFERSTVIGYDLRPEVPAGLPANMTLRAGNARTMVADGPFDLIYCLDALHHIPDAEGLIADVRPALAEGGWLLIAENSFTGDLDQDLENPFSFLAYSSSLSYCLQEALGAGGRVHTCSENPQWVAEAMTAAGYNDVGVRPTESGMAMVTGRA